jgi:hypothetical protein
MICFLKEVAAFTENNIHYAKKKKRKMPEQIDFYFDSIYIGRKKLFKFAKTKEWKVKAVTDYLKTKEYLFDKESPFYKGYEETVRFIRTNLMNGKMEKWDFYLKRFLAQKD